MIQSMQADLLNLNFLLIVYLTAGSVCGLCVALFGLFAHREQNLLMHIIKWTLAGLATMAAWPIVLWWLLEGELNRRRWAAKKRP